MTIDSGTTTEVFTVFIEQHLVKHLRAGDCVIMDNISVHKNARVKELIESTGAFVKFLPPYSPDLNPIEKLWSKLKYNLRRIETKTRDIFDNAVAEALKLIKTNELHSWILDAGYQISS